MQVTDVAKETLKLTSLVPCANAREYLPTYILPTSRGYYSLLYNLSKPMSKLYNVVSGMYLDKYGSVSLSKSKVGIECFTYNIIKAVKLGQKEVSFSSDNRRYKSVVINGKAISTGVGYESTLNIVDLFEKKGFLFRHTGYKISGEFGAKSKSGYIEITQKLIELVELNVDLDKIKMGARSDVLILRAEDNSSLEFPSTKYTKEIIKVLSKYNKLMDNHDVRLGENKLDTGLARIFNIDFQHGGRLYTSGNSYQGVAATLRKHITIDGNQTAEVDIKGSHISILHTIVGSRLLDGYDPYDIDMDGIAEYDLEKFSFMVCSYNEQHNPFRNLVKIAMLVMVNADSQQKASYALREKIDSQVNIPKDELEHLSDQELYSYLLYGLKNINIQKLFKAIKKKHDAIKEYFFSGAGVWLQKMEGDIFTKVLEQCIAHNYPVLVIHDSCRADVRHIKHIGDFITQAWYEVVGNINNLKLEYEF